MFVTQVHVKILELATTLEQGSLCACVLQFSEESHAKKEFPNVNPSLVKMKEPA